MGSGKIFWSQCLSEVMASSPLMMKEFTIWQRLATDRTFQWSDKPLNDHLGIWSGTGGNMWRELYLLLLASQHPGIVFFCCKYTAEPSFRVSMWLSIVSARAFPNVPPRGIPTMASRSPKPSPTSTRWEHILKHSLTPNSCKMWDFFLRKEGSHQCQFTKWFWAVKTCFTTMGGKYFGI